MHPLTLRCMRPTERQLLHAKLRTSTLPVRFHQRYRIVAEAAHGRSASVIADGVACDVGTVYLWIHRFNTSGFETFERVTNPNGRAPILTGPQVRALVKVALSRPADLGLPFYRVVHRQAHRVLTARFRVARTGKLEYSMVLMVGEVGRDAPPNAAVEARR
jgi:hypothetical protein